MGDCVWQVAKQNKSPVRFFPGFRFDDYRTTGLPELITIDELGAQVILTIWLQARARLKVGSVASILRRYSGAGCLCAIQKLGRIAEPVYQYF
jgi:hypothetical protein